MLNSLTLAALCLFPGTAQTTEPRGDDQSLIERVREAVGNLNASPGGVVAQGTADENGLESHIELLLRADGSFRFELTGELSRAAGSNAHTTWVRDWTGLTRESWLSERDMTVLPIWVLSGTWLTNPKLEIEDVTEEHGTPALRVARSDRRMLLLVDIDPKSALPSRVSYHTSAGEAHWTLDDWITEDAPLAFARTWTYYETGERRYAYEFDGLGMAPHYIVDPCTFRPTTPDDVTWNDEADVELEVERTRTGHILVHPLVNGRDLGWFLLDTGAGAMCIDTKVAEELDLPRFGDVTAVGVAGKIRTSFRRAATLTLGQMTIAEPILLELDLEMLRAPLGKYVAGIIGYDLFARALLELEVAAPRIALMRSEDYGEVDGNWRPLILDGNQPCVTARFEGGHEGFFKLDTGASGTVSFHSPAVVELGLLEGRETVDSYSGGVGGTRMTKRGVLDWFELAGHRFEKPQVAFSAEGIGAFSNRHTLGNIGQAFLEPFTLVFDYPGGRIAFLGGGE